VTQRLGYEKNLIEIEHLNYRYGEEETAFLALKDLNLKITQGEFVAITGASGSGKSTLMNLLGTLATTREGVFKIEGTDTSALEPDDLSSLRNRRIGFVFQQFHLLPRLSVLENILMPSHYLQPRVDAEARHHYYRRALELMTRLGIQDQAEKLPVHLSGGQKQRAAIARSLLLDPAIILADEPTGALDSKSSAEVMRIFAQLHDEGRTVILITHDPEVARIAKRRIELKDGRVVLDVQQEGLSVGKTQPEVEAADIPASLHPHVPRLSKWQWTAPLNQAWQALLTAKLRTALTCLGLIIGVTSITTMLTLGTAAQDVILKIFDTAGADRVYVGLDYQASRTNSNGYWQGLHVDQDLPSMQATFAPYGRISLLWQDFNQNAIIGGLSSEIKVDTLGSITDFHDQGLKLAKGRMIAPHEFRGAALVGVVGSDFAESMFPKQYVGRFTNPSFPIGEQIALRGRLNSTITIVGILKKRDTSFSDNDFNSKLFIPLSTLLNYTTEKRATWISVVPNKGVPQRWLADSVANYLKLKTGLKYPFRAEVPEESIGKVMLFITIFQALTTLIGGLCILVGGIGIMNIMLVTIAERIKEIGLRKALGARGRDIVRQFLAECMMLCVLSGLMGTFIGAVFCNIVAAIGHYTIPDIIPSQLLLNPTGLVLGLGTAILCGMTFGMMPAIRASKLDPSEALRSE
jgi:macrolide transport system ATP-binding/permease protein